MEEKEPNRETFEPPPGCPQFTFSKLLRMGLKSLHHHRTSSLLQFGTIAATAAFVAFILGELFVVRAARDLPSPREQPLGTVPQLLWMLGVALLVCTISNITSMLLNVSKRFREIGTIKCLGAFDDTVLALFLMEAFLLGISGSVTGATLGSLFSVLVALRHHGLGIWGGALAFGLLIGMVGTIILASALTLLGAAYPARRAGRMLPVEAMRTT